MEKNFGKFERDMTYRGNGPSKYYKNDKGQVFGILDNQSDKMCRGCDRFRMSANGYIKVCNFKPNDLTPYIESDESLKEQLLILGDYLHSRGNDYLEKDYIEMIIILDGIIQKKIMIKLEEKIWN